MMSKVVTLMIILKPAAMVMADEAPGKPSSAPSPFCLPGNDHHHHYHHSGLVVG